MIQEKSQKLLESVEMRQLLRALVRLSESVCALDYEAHFTNSYLFDYILDARWWLKTQNVRFI